MTSVGAGGSAIHSSHGAQREPPHVTEDYSDTLLAKVVIVTGADGYRVSFGIAEFDPGFTDRLAILADRKNGAPLTGDAAPFQLVLTGEKRPARWVRQVASIEVIVATSR